MTTTTTIETAKAQLETAKAKLEAARSVVCEVEDVLQDARTKIIVAQRAQEAVALAAARGDRKAEKECTTHAQAQAQYETKAHTLTMALKGAKRDADEAEQSYYEALADYAHAQAMGIGNAFIEKAKTVDEQYQVILALMEDSKAVTDAMRGLQIVAPPPHEFEPTERHHAVAFSAAVLKRYGSYNEMVRNFPGLTMTHRDSAMSFETQARRLMARVARANPTKLRPQEETAVPGSRHPSSATVQILDPATNRVVIQTLHEAEWISATEIEYTDTATGKRVRRQVEPRRGDGELPVPSSAPSPIPSQNLSGARSLEVDTAMGTVTHRKGSAEPE